MKESFPISKILVKTSPEGVQVIPEGFAGEPLPLLPHDEGVMQVRKLQEQNRSLPIVEINTEAARTREADAALHEDIYPRGQRKYLLKLLSDLHLRGFLQGTKGINMNISEGVMHADAEEYDGKLTLGLLGMDETCVAIAAATSKVIGSEGEKPITPIIPVTTSKGLSLFRDRESGSLFTHIFWEYQKGKGFVLRRTDEPIQLDGVISMYDNRDLEGSEKYLNANTELYGITDDKQRTKEILRNVGIPVPEGVYGESLEDIHRFIDHLDGYFDTRNGFVVKGNTGSQGKFVKLFDPSQRDEAKQYASELFARGQQGVIIERRIIPIPSDVYEPMKKIRVAGQTDYNIRVLTTISPNPQIIDSEVRFDKNGNSPVNIHQGARAVRIHRMIQVYDELEQIEQTSRDAMSALAREIGLTDTALGFVGFDIIVDKYGKAYVIEANSGAVGGIGTLTRLDRQPLASIASVLLPESRSFLENNHRNRIAPPDSLERYGMHRKDMEQEFMVQAVNGNADTGASIRRMLCNPSELGVNTLINFAWSLFQNGDTKTALFLYEEALKLEPSNITTLSNLLHLHTNQKDHNKALQIADIAISFYPGNNEFRFLKLVNESEKGIITREEFRNQLKALAEEELSDNPELETEMKLVFAAILTRNHVRTAEHLTRFFAGLVKDGVTYIAQRRKRKNSKSRV